jgi:hypothetical protein
VTARQPAEVKDLASQGEAFVLNSLSNYPVLRLTIHAATFSDQDSQVG